MICCHLGSRNDLVQEVLAAPSWNMANPVITQDILQKTLRTLAPTDAEKQAAVRSLTDMSKKQEMMDLTPTDDLVNLFLALKKIKKGAGQKEARVSAKLLGDWKGQITIRAAIKQEYYIQSKENISADKIEELKAIDPKNVVDPRSVTNFPTGFDVEAFYVIDLAVGRGVVGAGALIMELSVIEDHSKDGGTLTLSDLSSSSVSVAATSQTRPAQAVSGTHERPSRQQRDEQANEQPPGAVAICAKPDVGTELVLQTVEACKANRFYSPDSQNPMFAEFRLRAYEVHVMKKWTEARQTQGTTDVEFVGRLAATLRDYPKHLCWQKTLV
jgi:hypothetical protein